MAKSTYQTTYQDKIGFAKCSISEATVGTENTFQLTYTAGELGVDESGGIKVLFRTAGDCADAQFLDSTQSNFVDIQSSNTGVSFVVNAVSVGSFGKIHERPWSRGFSILVKGDYLSKGDTIVFTFTNWRMQTFAEKKFQFKVVVDPFATGRYLDLQNSPTIKLLADELKKIVVVVPSLSSVGQKVPVFVKAEDTWGNPVTHCDKTVVLQAATSSTVQLELASKVTLKKGIGITYCTLLGAGICCVQAKSGSITAISNPGVVVTDTHHSYFWADWHGQSEETIGTHSVEDYIEFPHKYAAIDITSLQGNDFQISNKFWKKINQTSKKLNKKGSFVVFPGYEWSGNTNKGGDRNVLYFGEGKKIHRSSHALLDEYSDITTDAETASDLFKKLDPNNTLVIPHVGGRYSDLNIHDPSLEPVVEIHSTWGTFEWFYHEALSKGYKVGVVANSDDHTGRMGASYPAFAHFNSYGGLTAVLAKELSRDAIFSAIKKRHCYATTGARIYIDAKTTNVKGEQFLMGDICHSEGKSVEMTATCVGTDAIEKIELYKGSTVLKRFYPERKPESSYLKVLYSGSSCRGRARAYKWEGSLTFNVAKIKDVEKINFYNKNNFLTTTEKGANWNGVTTGGVQGFILSLDKMKGKLDIAVNEKQFSCNLERLSTVPTTQLLGGLDAQISYYMTLAPAQNQTYTFTYNYNHTDKKTAPLYMKVTQRDGHMAWTSPVFVE